MTKNVCLLLLIASCAVLAGCSKDAEIDAFITELDSITTDMVSKIDADPSAAGIDAAQKIYDSRKPELQSKWDAIKGARGFQVSEDAKKKLEQSLTKNISALSGAMIKNAMKLASDPGARDKFQKLVKDYTDTFSP